MKTLCDFVVGVSNRLNHPFAHGPFKAYIACFAVVTGGTNDRWHDLLGESRNGKKPNEKDGTSNGFHVQYFT